MGKWLRKLIRRPFGRKREERLLLETDPGVPTAPVVPAQVDTRGCAWAAGASDQGRNRPNNEDDFLLSPERCLFIVCDGMGGHAAGEVASREAIEALDELLPGERLAEALAGGDETTKGFLREALQEANDRVVALGQENPSWSGMASTAVIAVLDGSRLHVSNLGDSRAYQVRGDDIRLLTKDHSVAAALMEQGQITPEQVRTHPLRNHLTASLGIPQRAAPAYTSVEVQHGDRIVLCSDGLWDMLSDGEIAQMAAAHRDPHEAAKALISAANAAGGMDNITVIVVIARSGPRGVPQGPKGVGAEEPLAEEQVAMETITRNAEPSLATEPSRLLEELSEQEA